MKEWTELNETYWHSLENEGELVRYSYRPRSKTLRLCLSEEIAQESGFDKYPVRIFANKHCTQLFLRKTPAVGYKAKRARHCYYLTFRFPEGIVKTSPGCTQAAEFEQTPEGLLINLQ